MIGKMSGKRLLWEGLVFPATLVVNERIYTSRKL